MNFQMNGRGSVAEGFEIFSPEGSRGSTSSRTSSTTLRFDRFHAGQRGAQRRIAVRLQRDDQDCQRAKNSRHTWLITRWILDRRAKSTACHLRNCDKRGEGTHSASVAQLDEEQVST